MRGLQISFRLILVSVTLVLLFGAQSSIALRDAEIGSQNAIRRHARRPQGSDPNHGLSRRFHSVAEMGNQDLEERQSLLELLDGALDDTTSPSSSSSASATSTSDSTDSTSSSHSHRHHHHNSTETSTRTRTRTHTSTRTRVATLSDDSTASESSSATHLKKVTKPSSVSSSASTYTSYNNGGLLGETQTSSDSSDQMSSYSAATSSSHASPSRTRVAQVAHHTFGSSSSSSSGSRPDESQSDADPDFFSFTPVTSTRTHSSAAATDTGLLGHLLGGGSDSSSTTRSESARPTQQSSSDSSSSVSSASDSTNSGSTSEQDSGTSGSSDSSSDGGQYSILAGPTSTSSASSASATSAPDSQDSGSSRGDGSSSGDDSTIGSNTSTGDASSSGAPTTTSLPTSTVSASVPTSSGSVDNGGSGVSSAATSNTSSTQSAPTSIATTSSSVTSSQASASQSLSSASVAGSGSQSNSTSSWSSTSAASTSDSSTSSSTSTNPYWYANTQSLNLAPASTTSYAPAAATQAATTDSGDTTTSTAGSSSTSQNYPSVIVPSANSLEQPSDTTSVALLFKNAMTWTWVISQADLTAQIFAFMPALIAQSIGIDASEVTTIKLSSYANSSSTSLTDSRTMYTAFIPTANVEDLQAMVANVSSPFYTDASSGAPQELASQVDSSFNILLAAGQTLSSAAQSSSTGSSGQTTLRKSLMGVGCSLAGCAIAALGVMVWKRQQQKKQGVDSAGANGLSRGQTIRSFQAGQRETWPAQTDRQDQDYAGNGDMQEAWTPSPYSDGFGGHVADPFQDQAHVGGAYVNMNRASRMTERSAYSDWSHMTEAQRIQYEYESSRRSYHSGSSHSGSHGEHSAESAGHSTSYQDDYQVPPSVEQQQGSGRRRSPTLTQNRRRGSVASSIIGRPEMVSNSVLL